MYPALQSRELPAVAWVGCRRLDYEIFTETVFMLSCALEILCQRFSDLNISLSPLRPSAWTTQIALQPVKAPGPAQPKRQSNSLACLSQ